MDLKDMESEDVDWMHLARNGDQWRARINKVMNFRVA
jgi:hypothetical protein